jgi:RNA polymerase sigma-70 factor (ECF subfamily)
MERKEVVHAVQANVDDLPSDLRNVLRLRYFEGRSVEETAQQMQRTPGAIRGLLHRAKVALRSALGRSSKWFHNK